MKFFKNRFYVYSAAFVLCAIIIGIAEAYPGYIQDAGVIISGLVILTAILLSKINLISELKRDYEATPVKQENIIIVKQNFYTRYMIISTIMIFLFYYGYREINSYGMDTFALISIIGGIICLAFLIKKIIYKKTKIENTSSTIISNPIDIKQSKKVINIFIIATVAMSFLYKFFGLSDNAFFIIGTVIGMLCLLYIFIPRKN